MRSGYVKNRFLFIVKSLGTNQPLRKFEPKQPLRKFEPKQPLEKVVPKGAYGGFNPPWGLTGVLTPVGEKN